MHALILGLPRSGKTTLLAAVWHVVNTGDIEGALELQAVGPHSHYLNGIWKQWLVGAEVDRSSAGIVEDSSMTLSTGGGSSVELKIPDLSGEHSNAVFLTRQWPAELEPLIGSADGLVVCIHAEDLAKPIRIEDALAVIDAPRQGQLNESSPSKQVRWIGRPICGHLPKRLWICLKSVLGSPAESIDTAAGCYLMIQ